MAEQLGTELVIYANCDYISGDDVEWRVNLAGQLRHHDANVIIFSFTSGLHCQSIIEGPKCGEIFMFVTQKDPKLCYDVTKD